MKKSISFNGAEISYTIKGSGNAVILLHGFGETSEVWIDLSSRLDQYLLIIPDLPGSGLSEPFIQEGVSLSDYASCMEAILNHENIETVHFIGHSMGGYIAMEFASMHAEKLRSLCLFHSSAFADDEEKIQTRRKAIDFIEGHGSSAFLKTSIPALFMDTDLHKTPIADLVESGGSFLPMTLVQYYKAMIKRKDYAGLLSLLKVPVLFIIGEQDKAVPFNISLNQCYLPAISFVHILRRSAHMGMYEEPERVTGIINHFLEEAIRV